MRNIFYTLIVFASVLVFASCNNGAYDANTDLDKTAVPNFLDPKYAQEVGEVKFKLNDEWVSFIGSQYLIVDTFVTISGFGYDGDVVKKLNFFLENYKGYGEYKMDYPGNQMDITFVTNPNPASDSMYIAVPDFGKANLNIIAESEDILYGTFDATLFRVHPSQDTLMVFNITEGSFKSRKYKP